MKRSSSRVELRRLAVIDIGTNSIHFLMVDVDPVHRRFKVVGRDRQPVRLGAGADDNKFLSEQVISDGVAAIRRFKALADSAGASVRAVATSAVRDARNRAEFARRVKAETDVQIEVASGFEEARLTYLGVLESLPVQNQSILLADVGGGSTEFLVGKAGDIHYNNSLRIGAVRLSQKFFPDGVASAKAVASCREFVAGSMTPVARDLARQKWKLAVTSSGTAMALAKMISAAAGYAPNSKIGGFVITRGSLNSLVRRIVSAKTVGERRKIPGLEAARADIVVAGSLIMEQIFQVLKLKQVTVSEYALREGIVMDTLAKSSGRGHAGFHEDPRYRSILHLAEHYDYETTHAHHVAYLALSIFDQTRKVHGLSDNDRDYLEAAAVLHEIGCYISHAQHHQHSYYLIRNAELLGFTDLEIEIIANVARYHRKSHPKMTHEGYSRLGPPDQSRVRRLSAILRIADGLDRTHTRSVKDVKFNRRGKNAQFYLQPFSRSEVHWEVWGAEQKKALFEQEFGLKVTIAPPE